LDYNLYHTKLELGLTICLNHSQLNEADLGGANIYVNIHTSSKCVSYLKSDWVFVSG
jgi:hypothetical protein